MPLLIAQAASPPQVTAPAPKADPKDDIVVVARRRPTALDGVTPQETLSEEQIGTFGARSVGDLIRKLTEDRGGQPLSIVVNGRRLESIADITSLPAEALQSLQLYPPKEGARFGFSPPGQVLNLTLKAHFRFQSLDVTGSGSTDGGARTVTDRANRGVLDRDNRVNGTVTFQADAGLRARDRPRIPFEPYDPTGDRSLAARSRRLDARLGAARPVGEGMLDMSMSASVSRTLNRLSATVAQSAEAESATIGASYNRRFKGVFGSVLFNLNAAQNRSLTSGQAFTATTMLPAQAIRSDTLGANVGMNLSGSLVKAPTGMVRFNLSVQRATTLTGIQDRVQGSDRRTQYANSGGQAGLTVPLVPSGGALAKALGTIEITPEVEYSGANRLGGAWGRRIGAQWTLQTGLYLSGSVARRAVAPSNDQINAPATIVIGRTAFDYRVGALVPVEQIVGGAPLARQSISDRQASANFTKSFRGGRSMSVNLNYMATTTDRPPFSVTDPSLFFERAFPGRFIRDARGTLIRIDTRPFSAVRQSSASLSAAVSLSGRWGGGGPASYAKAIRWNIAVNLQRRLQQTLLLAEGVPVIDLLATPFTLSTGARGRNRWNATWRIESDRIGGSVTTALTSGLTATVFGDPGTGVRVGSLAQVSAELFYQIRRPQRDKGTQRKSATPYRLDFNVQNLFNARPDIQTYSTAGVTRLNPWQLDPLGRTVRLSLRLPLGD